MSEITAGILSICNLPIMVLILLGTFMGIIVGAIPGLSVTMGVALFLPLTFGMDPIAGLSLLCGLYIGGTSGGLISAILLKMPGTAASVATTFDGHPMAARGEAGKALGVGIVASFFGGLISYIILMLLAPFIAKFALQFGPYEYFSIGLFSLTMIVSLSSGSLVKGVLSGMIGLILAFVGIAPITSFTRFTFGISELNAGFSMIPMLIGLFGITSILEMIESIKGKTDARQFVEDVKENYQKVKVTLPDRAMAKRLLPIWIQSSAIGNVIGIIPGAGMIMAIFMAYDQASRRCPNLEFGTGVPEGIAAPESANNAVVASSMVPLLSLGVPGNSTSSLFLGALTIQGLRTGPTLFRDTPEMAYMIILGFLLANIIMLPLSVYYCNVLATAVLRLNRKILSGIVLVLCVTGAFAVSNNIFNVAVMVFFGFVGYSFNKYKIPQSPLILASILGSMMENNWTQSMKFADGSLSVFVTRPLSCALLILSIIFIGLPLWKQWKAGKA